MKNSDHTVRMRMELRCSHVADFKAVKGQIHAVSPSYDNWSHVPYRFGLQNIVKAIKKDNTETVTMVNIVLPYQSFYLLILGVVDENQGCLVNRMKFKTNRNAHN